MADQVRLGNGKKKPAFSEEYNAISHKKSTAKAWLAVFLRHGRIFLLALGFLTRLVPAMQATRPEMEKTCLYYPVVGAVLGATLTLPLLFGLLDNAVWAQAWVYVLVSAWFTRALHLDGLADVLDALGSGKKDDEFYIVLKDSRLGAFGAVGLTLALGGSIVLVGSCLAAGLFAPLFFAPLYGRCLPVVLAFLTPARIGQGLGTLLATGPRLQALLFAVPFALVVGIICLGLPSFVLCLLLTAPCLFFLARVAKREGGYNGDFLGFIIISGELTALFSAIAFTSTV